MIRKPREDAPPPRRLAARVMGKPLYVGPSKRRQQVLDAQYEVWEESTRDRDEAA